jgi:ankyrin repeat protein
MLIWSYPCPQDGWTPLHTATYWKQLDVVAALLDAGARVDATDRVSVHARLAAAV